MNETVPTELNRVVEQLRGFDDPRRASREWKAVLNILRKCDLDQNRVANVVAGRNLEALEKLIAQLQNDEKPPPPDTGNAPPEGFTEEDLSKAMKAYRKRLKYTRLDDESQINSKNPLSRGEASKIDCIYPPFEWPREVWQCLAKRGKLNYVGRGFYELGPNG